jgi:hypothetical protein
LLPWLLLFGGFVAAFSTTGGGGQRPPPFGAAIPGSGMVAGFAIVLGCLGLVALPFLHAVRRAKEWAWWAGGIRFGNIAVACRLRPGGLIGIYWKLIGLGLVVLLGYAAAAAGLTAVLHFSAPVGGAFQMLLHGRLPLWGFAAYLAMYLILGIALGVLARIFTLQRVWQRVVVACAVINIADAADIAAAGDTVSAFGEGLADGLDFGL